MLLAWSASELIGFFTLSLLRALLYPPLKAPVVPLPRAPVFEVLLLFPDIVAI